MHKGKKRERGRLPACSVLGYVRLFEGNLVWDLQCCHGLQTTTPLSAFNPDRASSNSETTRHDVNTVWLPHATRPISLTVLQSFWGPDLRSGFKTQGIVPAYEELMCTLVRRVADKVGAVAALTRFLTCPEWRDALQETLASSDFENVAEHVLESMRNGSISPGAKLQKGRFAIGQRLRPLPENIFAAFNATPLSRIRVVVVGDRPYDGTVEVPSPLNNGCTVTIPRADGLAFSVPGPQVLKPFGDGVPLPSSLCNIFSELQSNFSIWTPPHGASLLKDLRSGSKLTLFHKTLEAWTRHGIMLLNASLTLGNEQNWRGFTDTVIKIINDCCKGVVFLFLGGESKQAFIDTKKHTIVKATPLLGSKCFISVNRALAKLGHRPFDWRV